MPRTVVASSSTALWITPVIVIAGLATLVSLQVLGSDGSVTITQTSTLAPLTPDGTAMPIYGTLRNDAADDAVVGAVNVSVAGILKSESTAGECLLSDYVITRPRMIVGRTVAPGETIRFEGATIEFVGTRKNQDACKGATLSLLYETSS